MSIKSNKNVKYLLPAVLLIWGFFFLRLFKSCNPEAPQNQTTAVATFTPPKTQKKEVFQLETVERDPFLGKAYTQKKQIANTSKRSIVSEESWPNIQYLGIVADGQQRKKIYILNINGKQQLFSRGDTQQEVTLVSGNEDKITLRFQGVRKSFEKQ